MSKRKFSVIGALVSCAFLAFTGCGSIEEEISNSDPTQSTGKGDDSSSAIVWKFAKQKFTTIDEVNAKIVNQSGASLFFSPSSRYNAKSIIQKKNPDGTWPEINLSTTTEKEGCYFAYEMTDGVEINASGTGFGRQPMGTYRIALFYKNACQKLAVDEQVPLCDSKGDGKRFQNYGTCQTDTGELAQEQVAFSPEFTVGMAEFSGKGFTFPVSDGVGYPFAVQCTRIYLSSIVGQTPGEGTINKEFGGQLVEIIYGFTSATAEEYQKNNNVDWYNAKGERGHEGYFTIEHKHNGSYKGSIVSVKPAPIDVPAGMNVVFKIKYDVYSGGSCLSGEGAYKDYTIDYNNPMSGPYFVKIAQD